MQTRARPAWSALWLALSCDPLDIVGQQEIVSERAEEAVIRDDDLSDKHPEYDPERRVVEDFDGCLVTLNKSASVTRLTLTPLEGSDAELDGRLFPTRRAALDALGERPVLPSMEVVNGALKPFNDGLYAAVELAFDRLPLLESLLEELVRRAEGGALEERAAAEDAAAHVGAALLLAGAEPTAPAAILDRARAQNDAFLDEPFFSTPIGFYDWNQGLGRIFRRDRWLQRRYLPRATTQDLTLGAAAAGALALAEVPALSEPYRADLELHAGLTNPFYDGTLLDLEPLVPDATAIADLETLESEVGDLLPSTYDEPACDRGLAYFPASDSAETRVLRDLVCGELAPGEDLLEALIQAVQGGRLDLTPRPDSGFYDHQLYALETLLAPDRAQESDHLLLTREYKEKLVETFKSILIQTRETHVKQVSIGGGDDECAPFVPREFDIYPKLLIEPFPTFYLRTARAYGFVENLLLATLGAPTLEATARLLEDGSRHDSPLAEELADKQRLLYGLHAVAADSIGAERALSADESARFDPEEARERALAWLGELQDDMDVNRDPRVSLPVAIEDGPDAGDAMAVYWAVAGVKVLRMHASFPDTHRPEVVDDTSECVLRHWIAYEPYLLVEQTLQARRPYTAAPLSREAFRRLCDEAGSLEAILRAFEAAP